CRLLESESEAQKRGLTASSAKEGKTDREFSREANGHRDVGIARDCGKRWRSTYIKVSLSWIDQTGCSARGGDEGVHMMLRNCSIDTFCPCLSPALRKRLDISLIGERAPCFCIQKTVLSEDCEFPVPVLLVELDQFPECQRLEVFVQSR